ncbi:MAG TPA: LysR family transcriptional regulator [Conexibacter sp.]|nr:LysR family transcriptional regulator [Conexibacter sp.]
MLNVARLRVLVEVVGRGSFSGAADALSYTQSAVSQAIATLEAETGATLLVRDRRGVRPTAAGAALVAHAEAVLARLRTAEDELAAIQGVRAGRLRMASFPTAGATLMPHAIAAFHAAHPGVELSLAEDEPELVAPRLRDGELDLALLFEFPGDGLALGGGVERRALLDDPLHVVLPADHPLAREPELELARLHDVAWVQTSVASPCARHVVRMCHAAGFEPQVSFESDDYETVQGLVAAGVGVALVPRLALARVRDGVVVRALSPDPPVRHIVAATAAGAGAAPAAVAMIDILTAVARRYEEQVAAATA